MTHGEESDSGMGSMPDSSKDCTPEKTRTCVDDDGIEDETLSERLWGLTEMFPEKVRNVSFIAYCNSLKGAKALLAFTKSAAWIFFSSSALLFAPVIFEVERYRVEEEQRSQTKEVLLGPNTSVAGNISTIR